MSAVSSVVGFHTQRVMIMMPKHVWTRDDARNNVKAHFCSIGSTPGCKLVFEVIGLRLNFRKLIAMLSIKDRWSTLIEIGMKAQADLVREARQSSARPKSHRCSQDAETFRHVISSAAYS